MSPKVAGVVILIWGAVCAWITYSTFVEEGRPHFATTLLAPALLIWGLALTLLPVEKLLIPKQTETGNNFDITNGKQTLLSIILLITGVTIGAGCLVYLSL